MIPKFSIQYKLLTLVTTLVVTSIGLYLAIAAKTIETDKTDLTYEMTKSSVATVSSELNTVIRGVVDKLRLYAVIYAGHSSQVERMAFKTILDTDPVLVRAEFHQLENGIRLKGSLTREDFSQLFNVPQSYFAVTLSKERPIPFNTINQNSVGVWNASVQDGPALIGVGVSILDTNNPTKKSWIVGYMRADLFLLGVKKGRLLETFVIDRNYKIIIHPNPEFMYPPKDFSKSGLVQTFLTNKISSAVTEFDDEGVKYLGAYSYIGFGQLLTVSRARQDVVFSATKTLIKRSITVGLVIIAIAFLATLLFSSQIINPLEVLVRAMQKIISGDRSVRFDFKQNDEVGVLASTFNIMIEKLDAAYSELESTNKNLEEKVRERTADLELRSKQLEELAVKDTLTGVYNRRYFNAKLQKELRRAHRYGSPLSLIYLDIDYFKKYNDTNGHSVGDILLTQFATILQDTVRGSDVVARLGGEEFCVILPNTTIEQAAITAEKLRSAVETGDFPNKKAQPDGKVTCSLGVSEFPRFAGDAETLVRSADDALYKAKQTGRNKVHLSTGISDHTTPVTSVA